MKQIRLLSSFMTVGFWTLLSRILGFVREILILNLIGPGPVMDAFVAAFRLPNMFRRFLAEGAFNAAFVPMFSKKLEGGENADVFASQALSFLSAVVIALTALAMIFMPAFVFITAEGFYGDERFDLTVGFGYILFPYIVFMSLSALFSGVLNASGKFAAAAAAPVLLNILAISAMILGSSFGNDVIGWLIWAIPLAGVAQLALLWRATRKIGIHLRLSLPKWNDDMKKLLVIAFPAALASGVLQINLLVGQLVASGTEKAISWLYAADRLYQLPLGVVGIAIGIVLLPSLSRHLKSGDTSASQDALSRAAEFSLALTLPCAVALFIMPIPLVRILFENGQTGPEDTKAIALAVAIYGLGLPAFVLQKVLQPIFFAREDTKTPFRFAFISMIVNTAIALIGAIYIGWLAAAFAAICASWVQVILLWIASKKFGPIAQFDRRFYQRIWKILLSSLTMGAFLYGVIKILDTALMTSGLQIIALIGVIISAIICYFGIGTLLGAFSLRELKNSFKRS